VQGTVTIPGPLTTQIWGGTVIGQPPATTATAAYQEAHP
jgi:hypothetical protein